MQSQPHRAQVARLSQTQPALGDPNSRTFREKGTRPERWDFWGWGVTGLDGLALHLSSAVLAPALAPTGSPGCGEGPTCSSSLLHPPPCIQKFGSSLTGQAQAACDREGAGPRGAGPRGEAACAGWRAAAQSSLLPGCRVSSPIFPDRTRCSAAATGHGNGSLPPTLF